MGKIRVYKKPNFTHNKTQEEYDSALIEVNDNINVIKGILSKKMNMVRLRILDICVVNLENAFKLKSFMRAVGLDDSKKKETETKIKWLNSQFIKQATYIQQIEKQIRDNNIDPFTEIVESLM